MRHLMTAIVFALFTNICMASDVLILRPDVPEFGKLGDLIGGKIGSDYKVDSSLIDKSTDYPTFKGLIEKSGARVVIVMDNHALRLLRSFFDENPQSKVRGIATMGVNLKDLMPRNKYISGVAYEIAGYLAVKGFNAAINGKTQRVVGVYRSSVSKVFAEDAKAQLAREKIKMTLLDIEGVPDSELGKFIKDGIEKERPEAVWIVNDNKIINSNMISTVWFDLARQAGLPIICGIQKLGRELGICVYTETPTLQGISQKVSDIVFGYIADENDADFFGVEYVQETERTTNRFLREKLGFGTVESGVDDFTGDVKQK